MAFDERDPYERLLELHELEEERRAQHLGITIPAGFSIRRPKIFEDSPSHFTETDAQALIDQDIDTHGEAL